MTARTQPAKAPLSHSSEPGDGQDSKAIGTVSSPGRPDNVSPIGVQARSHDPLSAREFEVLHWLSEGKSGNKIAQILGISLGTIRVHIRNINLKLSAANIPHAVAQGFKRGILGR